MSTIFRTAAIPASGKLILGPGNFFFLISATAVVDVIFAKGGTEYGAEDIQAGYLKGKVEHWDRSEIRGTAGVTVSYFFGVEELREDITDFRQQIATIAGIVAMLEQPSSSVATPDDDALAASTTETIAANLSRRRITIGCLSTNTVGFRVQAAGANDSSGLEVQPGTFVELRTTAALDIRNNDAATATSYYVFEET